VVPVEEVAGGVKLDELVPTAVPPLFVLVPEENHWYVKLPVPPLNVVLTELIVPFVQLIAWQALVK